MPGAEGQAPQQPGSSPVPIRALGPIRLQVPVILAPLAGGPSTPELVAAVSGAGGLGILGAAYLGPSEIVRACREVRALTDRPFGVNLFAGGWREGRPEGAEAAARLLAPFHARLGLPAPAATDPGPDPFPAQLEAVLQERPALLSFTFGIPTLRELAALHDRGILTLGTATSAQEARLLAAAGVEAVVAQGLEAGGHRGSFAASHEEGLVPTERLVREIAALGRLPVVAAGGLMDGADAARVLRDGAAAAMLGTAFLACPEAGTSAAYRQALLSARDGRTVLTRAFSGRWARGLPNELTEAGAAHPEALLPYPAQNALTRPLRAAAAKAGMAGLLSLWAGTGVGRLRAMPAAELVRTLAEEIAAAHR